MAPNGEQEGRGHGGITLHLSRRALRRAGAAVVAVLLIAVGFGIGRATATRGPKLPSTAELSCKGAACRHPAPSSMTTSRQSALITTTTGPAASTTSPPSTTTTTPAPLPQVADCGGTPTTRPGSLYWCTSMCSSYMTDISWTTWGPSSAAGTGTWITKTTTPHTGQTFVPCSQAVSVHHPGSPIELSTPRYVTTCPSGAGPTTVLLFTHANVSVGVTPTSNACRS